MKIKTKYIYQSIFGVILIILARLGLKDDFIPFMKWWMVLLLLGIIFLPLTHKIFSYFHDNGYLFSKTIGIAITGYLMWLCSSIRMMKFNSLSCEVIVILCLVVNILIFYHSQKSEKKALFATDKLDAMITEEILFLAAFLIWTYIRGFKPEAYGTEKFMDYGFMNIMMRADYMPPKDLWFAGSSINYYYVGQFMATFMTKLSLVTVNVGYNLMLMTLAAFSFVLPYSLVLNIMKNYQGKQYSEQRVAPRIAGLLSGAGVCLTANMHFPIYYWLIPAIRNMIGIKHDAYWFPDSTRYIGYDPETTDKTIHEFPSYSFILGDLHAHVINIMFVLTVLAILYAWLLYRKKQVEETAKLISKDSILNIKDTKSIIKEILHPNILLVGFFIGLFHTTNYWDFPIYYVVAGAVILFNNAITYRFKLKTIWLTSLHGVVVIATAKLIALPFTLNFDQISTEIYLTVARTPLYQLIILWGLPCLLVIVLFIDLISNFKNVKKEKARIENIKNSKKDRKDNNVIITNKNSNINIAETNNNVNITDRNNTTNSNDSDVSKSYKELKITNKIFNSIKDFMTYLHVSDLFILTLGLCAIGLILIPEIIYVKDIYSGDYKRANTMFKLTYQAFIMFGICSGYIFIKFLNFSKKHSQKIFAAITLVLFIGCMWYSKVAITAWYGNVTKVENYKGLDAAAFLETTMPDDYLAIQWLNSNIKGTPVVLEANGDSYSDYERVSVFTGLPTVVGWYVHEWLWRGSNTVVDDRAAEIKTIYTSNDLNQVNSLIDKYNIEYIYVGKLEREKYTTVNEAFIKSLGEVVFSSPITQDKDYETYIVHIDPKG